MDIVKFEKLTVAGQLLYLYKWIENIDEVTLSPEEVEELRGMADELERIEQLIDSLDLDELRNELDEMYTRIDAVEKSVAEKQDTLTAGDNIKIENNVISAIIPDTPGVTVDDTVTENSSNPVKSSGIYRFVNDEVKDVVDKADVAEADAASAKASAESAATDATEAIAKSAQALDAVRSKQDKLTAGANITIVDNVISATASGGGDITVDPTVSEHSGNPVASSGIYTYVEAHVDGLTTEIQETSGVAAEAHTDATEALKQIEVVASTANEAITLANEAKTDASGKQDKLTAGDNITIQDNVISATTPDVTQLETRVSTLETTVSDLQDNVAENVDDLRGELNTVNDTLDAKQNALVAGDNITLEPVAGTSTVKISAAGGGGVVGASNVVDYLDYISAGSKFEALRQAVEQNEGRVIYLHNDTIDATGATLVLNGGTSILGDNAIITSSESTPIIEINDGRISGINFNFDNSYQPIVNIDGKSEIHLCTFDGGGQHINVREPGTYEVKINGCSFGNVNDGGQGQNIRVSNSDGTAPAIIVTSCNFSTSQREVLQITGYGYASVTFVSCAFVFIGSMSGIGFFGGRSHQVVNLIGCTITRDTGWDIANNIMFSMIGCTIVLPGDEYAAPMYSGQYVHALNCYFEGSGYLADTYTAEIIVSGCYGTAHIQGNNGTPISNSSIVRYTNFQLDGIGGITEISQMAGGYKARFLATTTELLQSTPGDWDEVLHLFPTGASPAIQDVHYRMYESDAEFDPTKNGFSGNLLKSEGYVKYTEYDEQHTITIKGSDVQMDTEHYYAFDIEWTC